MIHGFISPIFPSIRILITSFTVNKQINFKYYADQWSINKSETIKSHFLFSLETTRNNYFKSSVGNKTTIYFDTASNFMTKGHHWCLFESRF